MCYRSQATASVFIKRDLANTLSATIANLHQHLQQLPPSTIPYQIMHFSSSLRLKRAFCTKARGELSDMIIQQGKPTFFFILSVVDTKWHNLHMAIPSKPPSNVHEQYQWRIQNIVANPHRASLYVHCTFTISLGKGPAKRVPCNGFLVQFWNSAFPSLLYIQFASCKPLTCSLIFLTICMNGNIEYMHIYMASYGSQMHQQWMTSTGLTKKVLLFLKLFSIHTLLLGTLFPSIKDIPETNGHRFMILASLQHPKFVFE